MDYKAKFISLINDKTLPIEQRKKLEEIYNSCIESEDERIKREIVRYINLHKNDERKRDEWIAWLEKQGEQNSTPPKWKYKKDKTPLLRDSIILNKYGCVAKSPSGAIVSDAWVLDYDELTKLPKEEIENQGEQKPIDKIEPKFHEGDYIVDKSGLVQQVLDFRGGMYTCTYNSFTTDCESNYHLWTIDDATDGDILSYVTDEDDLWIMIYWSLYKPYEGHVHYHALLVNNDFSDKGTCCICINDLKPATKEQSSILFEKMHEAGYEWDAEKKELRKIEKQSEQKPAWSEEDDRIYYSLLADIRTRQKNSTSTLEAYYNEQIEWLESLKQRMGGQQ